LGRSVAYRILIVDDSPTFRRALRWYIEQDRTWEVCGEAENGQSAAEIVDQLHPDLIILDLSMPVMNGLAATEALRAVRPQPRVVVLTAEAGVRPEVEAVGANALVPKDLRSGALLGCLRTVVVGGCGCCPYCL
jgi:DNA-binding NarL/FixJ family response regulator